MNVYSTSSQVPAALGHDATTSYGQWHGSVAELDRLLDDLVVEMDGLSTDIDTRHVRIVIIELRARCRGWQTDGPVISRSDAMWAALRHCSGMARELIEETRALRREADTLGLPRAPRQHLPN